MGEVKYETVFGDQSLFDDVNDDDVWIVIELTNGRKLIIGDFTENGLIDDDDAYIYRIAMRRIIKTPVWTKADQLAGKLPEVGCEVKVGSNVYTIVAVNADEQQLCLRDNNDGDLYISYTQYIHPIESPEEKVQRLEDDWVNKAWGETAVFAGVTQDEHDRLKIHLRHIYRAQLSGELTVPSR